MTINLTDSLTRMAWDLSFYQETSFLSRKIKEAIIKQILLIIPNPTKQEAHSELWFLNFPLLPLKPQDQEHQNIENKQLCSSTIGFFIIFTVSDSHLGIIAIMLHTKNSTSKQHKQKRRQQ